MKVCDFKSTREHLAVAPCPRRVFFSVDSWMSKKASPSRPIRHASDRIHNPQYLREISSLPNTYRHGNGPVIIETARAQKEVEQNRGCTQFCTGVRVALFGIVFGNDKVCARCLSVSFVSSVRDVLTPWFLSLDLNLPHPISVCEHVLREKQPSRSICAASKL